MKNKMILMTGIATAAICGASISSAIADDFETNSNTIYRYDSQAEETRALNIRALESAQDQNGDIGADEDDADSEADQQDGFTDGPLGPVDSSEEDDVEGDKDTTLDKEKVPSDRETY